jgi:hypothetical protein
MTTRQPLYPQKLALTSPTSGVCSVGIVRSRTEAMEFSFSFLATYWLNSCILHSAVHNLTRDVTIQHSALRCSASLENLPVTTHRAYFPLWDCPSLIHSFSHYEGKVLSDMTPCSLVDVYRSFRGTFINVCRKYTASNPRSRCLCNYHRSKL